LHSKLNHHSMNPELKKKMIDVCNKKIEAKGETVGISFYAFFKNKNDNPALLMEAATWWIQTHQLDHFEKATKIRQMVNA
jgi:hypothetical protein